MCGITGIYSPNKNGLAEKIRSATGTLIHRGPEREGYFFDRQKNLALGHRRLCIIDLSDAAGQPLTYRDRYTIVFNGELYNYIELKEQLFAQGYSFQTASDTEVVVAAYAAFGAACLQQFDGMFAFAIWDEQEQELFAARDRFGEKPFFFYKDETEFAFASELKALWAMEIPKQVNKALLYNFLNIGYTNNPANPPETFFENIAQLPAASFLVYKAHSGQLTTERYWQVFIETNHLIDVQSAIDQFKHLFSESVRRRLRSDVAVGTSLSGGLDSSAIVAFCNAASSATYTHKCFTAVFQGFEKNEEAFATKVAQQYGLQHFPVTIREDEVADLMTRMMYYQEQPVSSSSPLAQFKVFEAARQNGVTVLLDGQGADETMGGYSRYYRWYWQELYRKHLLKAELEAAQSLGVREVFNLPAKAAARFPHFAAAIQEGRKARQAYRNKDLDRDFAFEHKQQFYYALPATPDLNGALHYNTFVNGLDELLHLADRNSMAHSVEVRLPFLDHTLVEFLFSLPSHLKIHSGWTKWLLRKATEDLLPAEIVWRKDKIGFEPPQKQWMQNKKVQESIRQAQEKLVKEGILDSSVLKKAIEPKAAHAPQSNQWRYWSASYLFD